jgi:hypothetical protein
VALKSPEGVAWLDFHSSTRGFGMDRRAFIGSVAGGLLSAQLTANAQQAAKVWRIGYLDGSSPSARTTLIDAFKIGFERPGRSFVLGSCGPRAPLGPRRSDG